MNRTSAFGASVAVAAIVMIGAGWALRSRTWTLPGDRAARSADTEKGPEDRAPRGPAPSSPQPSEPQRRGEGGEPTLGAPGAGLAWREAQGIIEALIGDDLRRRQFLGAFMDMTNRLREIEKARGRCVFEGNRTILEVPAFREEGKAIHADWLKTSLAILTPEEGARFTRNPEFESGRLSPELDLLRTANVFFGSRHGKDLEPDLSWEQTRRIDAQRLGDGTVQVRLGSPEHISFLQFQSQQEALNYLTREYGHLLGPVPQLFR